MYICRCVFTIDILLVLSSWYVRRCWQRSLCVCVCVCVYCLLIQRIVCFYSSVPLSSQAIVHLSRVMPTHADRRHHWHRPVRGQPPTLQHRRASLLLLHDSTNHPWRRLLHPKPDLLRQHWHHPALCHCWHHPQYVPPRLLAVGRLAHLGYAVPFGCDADPDVCGANVGRRSNVGVGHLRRCTRHRVPLYHCVRRISCQ